MMEALSPLEIRSAQILVGITTAVFIGLRFLPERYRHGVGVGMTVCYLAGIAAFIIYVLIR